MSDLSQQFANLWAPYRDQQQIVVACSGGPDSVALVCLLNAVHPHRKGLLVAHFHHGLRGVNADEDARFVCRLCQRLELAFIESRADPQQLRALAVGQGIEAAARQLRYAFLRRTAEDSAARYLVTGHTADDQVETVLHHVLRGTSLAGLAGMEPVRRLSPAVSLLRPLLEVSRDQLRQHLGQLGQEYRLDEHNEQREFLRSRIRHELLPLLERDYAPGVRASLLRLARIAGEAQAILREQAQSLLDRCLLAVNPHELQLDCRPLHTAGQHLRRRAFVVLWQRQNWPLQSMTFEHWQQLAQLAEPDTTEPGRDFPGAIRAACRGERLFLTVLP